ncbi:MAG TPA: serine protease, partial [Chitinophagaceae bacterium]|nr:serine protease [Chitinophagaceae bacterium]
AVEWLCGYLSDQHIGAFEVASSLRQMEEVWKLDMNSEMGKLILPLLRAELLKREGGNVMVGIQELKQQKATEQKTTAIYEELLTKPGATEEVKESNAGLEKVFGSDSYNTYKWMMTANDRGLAVARIGKDAAKGFGTGFLLPGKILHEKLKDEYVLLTNAHVVSEDPNERSLRCYEAVLIFEALSRDDEFHISEIIWSSPSTDLDTSILRFDAENTSRLKKLMKNVKLYPVAPSLPGVHENLSERIYIIGHPAGGTLQFSLQDNLLLDHEDPRIHYRTPTIGGSSGSPVFNARWDLIGLHHAGRKDMPKLNGKEGYYEANEGIWIQAVRNQLKKVL